MIRQLSQQMERGCRVDDYIIYCYSPFELMLASEEIDHPPRVVNISRPQH